MRNRGLNPVQKELRDGRLTASKVGVLMSGNDAAILRLWEEMIGIAEEEDLEWHWPAQLGLTTEGLNLDWYEHKRGTIVHRRGEVVTKNWMGCTLDGWDREGDHPVEAKHVGGFEAEAVVISRYQPQLHWTMLVTGASKVALSVIYGAKEPVVDLIEIDRAYADILYSRAKNFMELVHTMTPPGQYQKIEAPPLPEKRYSMMETSSANMWADRAHVWLENVDAVKKAGDAEKDLKGMVPVDAKIASGAGVKITRDRAGRLSLRREKDV